MHPVHVQEVAECRIQDLLRDAAAARLAHQIRAARRSEAAARSRRARAHEDEVRRSASRPRAPEMGFAWFDRIRDLAYSFLGRA